MVVIRIASIWTCWQNQTGLTDLFRYHEKNTTLSEKQN